MPQIRPFRALRYVPDAVGDLAAVVAPPYDVLSPQDRARLAGRHPKNVVRLDAPAADAGDADDGLQERSGERPGGRSPGRRGRCGHAPPPSSGSSSGHSPSSKRRPS